MLVDAVRAMYAYAIWADARIFDAAEKVPPPVAIERPPGGAPSLVATLLHMVDAHRADLSWWDGSATTVEGRARIRHDSALFLDVASVRRAWEPVQAQTAAFLGRLSEKSLATVYELEQRDGRIYRQALWELMVNIANHGTQHRSEVAMMTTAAGYSPGDLDLVEYLSPDFV